MDDKREDEMIQYRIGRVKLSDGLSLRTIEGIDISVT